MTWLPTAISRPSPKYYCSLEELCVLRDLKSFPPVLSISGLPFQDHLPAKRALHPGHFNFPRVLPPMVCLFQDHLLRITLLVQRNMHPGTPQVSVPVSAASVLQFQDGLLLYRPQFLGPSNLPHCYDSVSCHFKTISLAIAKTARTKI